MLSQTLIDRFWSKVIKAGPDECWLWTGCQRNRAVLKQNGYGSIKIPKTRHDVAAHRLSLMIKYNEWQPNPKIFACHTCDNPQCVNPNHLFWGDNSDNQKDAFSKGRGGLQHSGALYLKGQDNPYSTLDDKVVKDIIVELHKGATNKALGAKYGVCHQTISLIRLGKAWKHLTGGPITKKYASIK